MAKKLIKDSTLSAIADAIRDKGGASGPMTPQEMPAKIAAIPTEGGADLPALDNPAGSAQILSGFQAINGAGVKMTGSHVCPTVADLTKDATAGAGDILKGQTAYVNGEKVIGSHVCEAGLDTSDATATPDQVAAGATFYADGEKKEGTVYTVDSNLNEFGELSASSDRITLATSFDEPTLFPAGTKHNVRAYLNKFGDATAADVASGKTFTSASGVKVTGSATIPVVLQEVTLTAQKEMYIQNMPENATHLEIIDKWGNVSYVPDVLSLSTDVYVPAMNGSSDTMRCRVAQVTYYGSPCPYIALYKGSSPAQSGTAFTTHLMSVKWVKM